MNRKLMTGLAAVLGLWGATAFAEEPVAGRYAMQESETGIARLDTRTGEVSLCREKDGEMVCRMAADERTAFELELDLLAKRVETLEKAAANGQTALKPRLPTKEEIDQTMSVMERMMRSFMGIVKDLDGKTEQPSGHLGEDPRKT